MSLEEQDIFFKKVLQAIQKYFPDLIILSTHVHRDEVFHPLDKDMKALFPEGKVTPHMHVIAIPIIHDKKIALIRIAIDEEIIVENPMNGIYIKAKFRAVRKKSDCSKLYLNDEFDALDTRLEEESTIEALYIQLMFQLGVRIGEGIALKFTDI